MDLYPAIDLRSGKVVRLARGDYEHQTIYDDDPVGVARRFDANRTTRTAQPCESRIAASVKMGPPGFEPGTKGL